MDRSSEWGGVSASLAAGAERRHQRGHIKSACRAVPIDISRSRSPTSKQEHKVLRCDSPITAEVCRTRQSVRDGKGVMSASGDRNRPEPRCDCSRLPETIVAPANNLTVSRSQQTVSAACCDALGCWRVRRGIRRTTLRSAPPNHPTIRQHADGMRLTRCDRNASAKDAKLVWYTTNVMRTSERSDDSICYPYVPVSSQVDRSVGTEPTPLRALRRVCQQRQVNGTNIRLNAGETSRVFAEA